MQTLFFHTLSIFLGHIIVKLCQIIFLVQKQGNEEFAYMVTFDYYILAFKQSPLYCFYLFNGPSIHGPNQNELLLWKAHMSNDLQKIVIVVAKYTSN